MTSYKLTHEGYVIRNTDTKIPITDTVEHPNTNPDYLSYLDWLEAGNVPDPADPLPAVVPTQVTRAQGKSALILAGLWQQVVAYVNSITDTTQRLLAETALYDTLHWRRDSEFLQHVATVLELSQAQLDQLFITAETLNP